MYLNFNFCMISTNWWHAIQIASLLSGAGFGLVLQRLFKGAGLKLDSSRLQTFAGGCLLPVIFGLACAIGFYLLIPDDPCGGTFAADAYSVFVVILPFTVVSAIGTFWISVWRR